MEKDTKSIIVSAGVAALVIRIISYFNEVKMFRTLLTSSGNPSDVVALPYMNPLGIIYLILQLLVIFGVLFGFFYLVLLVTKKLR